MAVPHHKLGWVPIIFFVPIPKHICHCWWIALSWSLVIHQPFMAKSPTTKSPVPIGTHTGPDFAGSVLSLVDQFPSLTGWWYTYPSEKYEFVTWDDDIPNLWKVIKFHGSSHHQSAIFDVEIPYLTFVNYGKHLWCSDHGQNMGFMVNWSNHHHGRFLKLTNLQWVYRPLFPCGNDHPSRENVDSLRFPPSVFTRCKPSSVTAVLWG